jgi:uncharacterized BrkB/YihY/UPF0761 family membrane protein
MMLSSLFVIWLLVAAIIFVYCSMPFDRASPQQPIWLAVLAVSWPLLIPYMAIGALVTLMWLSAPERRDN